MKTDEIGKGEVFLPAGAVEYVTNSVVAKTILQKLTGMVRVIAVDSGQALTERTSPFDMFVQVIDGAAEVIIDTRSTAMNVGDGVIIPAHTRNSLVSSGRFKIITTTIKSGYEDVS